MKKSNFSEPQIIKILASQESGKSVSDICREHGISQGTFYKWKSRYSGMEVSQVKQLKDLETGRYPLVKILQYANLKLICTKWLIVVVMFVLSGLLANPNYRMVF